MFLDFPRNYSFFVYNSCCGDFFSYVVTKQMEELGKNVHTNKNEAIEGIKFGEASMLQPMLFWVAFCIVEIFFNTRLEPFWINDQDCLRFEVVLSSALFAFTHFYLEIIGYNSIKFL